MKVYLAGPIAGCTDAEAKDWRDYARRELAFHYSVLDPMTRDFRQVEIADPWGDVVGPDLDDIDQCNAVLAMAQRPSWGTAMEIQYASNEDKFVVAVVNDLVGVSPWLRVHTNLLVLTLDDAIEALKARA